MAGRRRRPHWQWLQSSQKPVVHFPPAGEIRLSPAYDIVPTILYVPRDTPALQFAGTHNFENVTFKRITRIARFLSLDADHVVGELQKLVGDALSTWPATPHEYLDEEWAKDLIQRFDTLALVQEALGQGRT